MVPTHPIITLLNCYFPSYCIVFYYFSLLISLLPVETTNKSGVIAGLFEKKSKTVLLNFDFNPFAFTGACLVVWDQCQPWASTDSSRPLALHSWLRRWSDLIRTWQNWNLGRTPMWEIWDKHTCYHLMPSSVQANCLACSWLVRAGQIPGHPLDTKYIVSGWGKHACTRRKRPPFHELFIDPQQSTCLELYGLYNKGSPLNILRLRPVALQTNSQGFLSQSQMGP